MTFLPKLGEHGQESAPFELLVAVIIMTFVIIIGTTAVITLNKEKCKGEVEAEMKELKVAIERVATAKGKQVLNFSPPVCFEEKYTTIEIKQFSDPELCVMHCGGATQECTLLIYTGGTEFSSWNCLKISWLTVFHDDDGCPEKDGYNVIPLREVDSIPAGHYMLVGRFNVTSSFPIICAYRKA